MSIHVIGVGIAGEDDPALAASPEFRKATRNMRLAFLAARQALEPVADRSRLALALGSSYGELDVTAEFLVTLERSGVARPLLFQSSLHNATTGFLALRLGITGPTLTVSDRYLSGERALETAILVLEEGDAELCLALGVDACAPGLRDAIGATYAENSPFQPSEGAAAVLLASGSAVDRGKLRSLATLDRIMTGGLAAAPEEIPGERRGHYDSDAISHLVRAIREDGEKRLKLLKPDLTRSEILWSRASS